MVTRDDQATNRFLASFFGADNEVQQSAQLEPWIERLQEGKPTILPARASDGALRLYALSSSPAAARGFSEELVAAIGPSWSDFTGAATPLDATDPIEAVILEYEHTRNGGPTYRLVVHDREAAWNAMKRLSDAWSRRPAPRE